MTKKCFSLLRNAKDGTIDICEENNVLATIQLKEVDMANAICDKLNQLHKEKQCWKERALHKTLI